jgi:putative membrane protein
MSKESEKLEKKIEEKIKHLESKTSVEFVSVVAERSNSYFLFRTSLCLALAFFFLSILTSLGIFSESKLILSSAAILAAALFWLLFSWNACLRLLLPKQLKHLEVEEAARLAFLNHEVFATQKRTGVLIYISELEHSVFILADKGLLNVVPANEWAGLAAKLALELSHKESHQVFEKALDEISTKLIPHFPASATNPNELSDELKKA